MSKHKNSAPLVLLLEVQRHPYPSIYIHIHATFVETIFNIKLNKRTITFVQNMQIFLIFNFSYIIQPQPCIIPP